jgi:hypothetical protein
VFKKRAKLQIIKYQRFTNFYFANVLLKRQKGKKIVVKMMPTSAKQLYWSDSKKIFNQ